MLNLLCVTQEAHLINGVTHAFPEFDFKIKVVGSLEACAFATDEMWDVLIFDTNGITSEPSRLLYQLEPVRAHAQNFIAVVSPRHSSAEANLRQSGMVVLHRPITTGELVLTLNRVLRPSKTTVVRQ